MRSMRKRVSGVQPRRTQSERKRETRRKLIDTAVKHIAKHGLANSTISQIAKGAGLTTGALQFHFGSREELLVSVAADFGERLYERMGEPVPVQAGVEKRLSLALDEMWNLFTQNDFIAITEILLESRSKPSLHRDLMTGIRRATRKLDERWCETFSDTGLSREELQLTRHVALATIRGLAIRLTYWNEQNSWGRERTYLLRMLMAMFRQAEAPTPGQRRFS